MIPISSKRDLIKKYEKKQESRWNLIGLYRNFSSHAFGRGFCHIKKSGGLGQTMEWNHLTYEVCWGGLDSMEGETTVIVISWSVPPAGSSMRKWMGLPHFSHTTVNVANMSSPVSPAEFDVMPPSVSTPALENHSGLFFFYFWVCLTLNFEQFVGTRWTHPLEVSTPHALLHG